jgi:mitochondrial fission protein ELM1
MSADGMTRRVWLISDGNPGHYNQSAAITDLLAEHHDISVTWVESRLTLRGFLRPLLAWLLNVSRSALPDALVRRCYKLPGGLPDETPDLIVSSGGKTAFLNVSLARKTGAKNVFIGTPPRIHHAGFTQVLVLEKDTDCGNCLLMETIPTRVTPVKSDAAGREYRRQHGLADQRLWCMLIGGASRSHRFTADDWERLAQAMNALAARNGIKWLITTSRRTGLECETILARDLDPAYVADAAYWGSEPRKVVLPFLGAAEVAFSTQDSVTMITEAMASGKPAYAVYPQTVRLEHESARFFRDYLKRNTALGRLRTVPIPGLGELDVDQDMARHFVRMREPLTAGLSLALRDLLATER